MSIAGTIMLLLWSAGAPMPRVGVHLEDSEDVAPPDALELVDQLAQKIEHATGRTVALDDPTWASSCSSSDRCLGDVRARTQADDLVLVRLYGGPLKIHVVADRITRTSTGSDRILTREANIPRDKANWSSALEPIASSLFDGAHAHSDTAANARPQPAPAIETKSPIQRAAPWILLGTSAASAGVGIAFGLSAQHAKNRIESELLTAPDYQDLSNRYDRDKIVADLLFAVALAAAVLGIVWLLD